MARMVKAYEEKYAPANGLIAVKAVGYFGDINPKKDPVKMVKALPFKKVQQRIEQALIHFDKIF